MRATAHKREVRTRLAADPSTAITVPMAPGVPDAAAQAPRPASDSPWPLALKVAFGVTALSTLTMWFLDRRYMKKAAEEAKKSAETPVAEVVKSASPAAVKAALPKGADYLADIAFELAPKYDVNPYTILAITKHESAYGLAGGFSPKGPAGTGDFIPRRADKCVERGAGKSCKKTLEQLVQEVGFPVRRGTAAKECKTKNGVVGPPCLTPTERGWGHGLYQIDLQSHQKFIASGGWSDPRAAMEYALKLFTFNRTQISKALPNLASADLLQATIAAYNAGPKPVIAALKAGVPANKLDQGKKRVTYSVDYVAGILNTQAKLSAAGKAA